MNKFWESWDNINNVERRAIESLEKAVDFLFENVPKRDIHSIYVKGSFVRREMNGKSDVDIVPIVEDDKTLKKILDLDKKNGSIYWPSDFAPISIPEFEKNRRTFQVESPKARPDQFLSYLKNHKLIYGIPLEKEKYPTRNTKERLTGLLKGFESFISLYQNKEFSFSGLIKGVFWLTDLEIELNGEEPPGSWRELDKYVKDKSHIIHETYQLRLQPTKDKQKREEYMIKLSNYIGKLKGNLDK